METISFITSAISAVVTLLIGILIGRCFNNNINYNNSKHHVKTQHNPVKKKKLSKKERRKQKTDSTEWITCDIIVAKEESTYRKAVINHVKETDSVLEIGCHVGVTTALISKYAKSSFGIDSSEFSIQAAKKRFSHDEKLKNLHFFCADASDKRSVVKCLSNDKYKENITVIFIDVSGNRDPGFVLNLMESYDRIFHPRLFVIKNFKLQNFVEKSSISY